MRRPNPIVWMLPALLLVSACGGDEPATKKKQDKPAVTVSIKTLNLGDLMDVVEAERDKPLVVNLWAAWCEPCITEFPFLTAMAKRLDGKADMIGVSLDFADNNQNHSDIADAVKAAKAAAEAHGLGYPIYLGDDKGEGPGGFYAYFGVERSVPWTIVYDKDGKRLGAHSDFESADQAVSWFGEVTSP